MGVLTRLALLFVLVPLAELALLIRLGQWVGLLPTIGLVVTTGLAGAALARGQGIRTLLAIRQEMNSGRIPGQPLLDGLTILIGGALLLTPGLITDLLGFSLLIPASRRWLQARVRRRIERGVKEGRIEVFVVGDRRPTWDGEIIQHETRAPGE